MKEQLKVQQWGNVFPQSKPVKTETSVFTPITAILPGENRASWGGVGGVARGMRALSAEVCLLTRSKPVVALGV